MTNILQELWYGRVDPYTECKKGDDETKQLEAFIERHKESLMDTSTEAQKEILEKLLDCYNELSDINEKRIFSCGFTVGMRIAVSTLQSCDE